MDCSFSKDVDSYINCSGVCKQIFLTRWRSLFNLYAHTIAVNIWDDISRKRTIHCSNKLKHCWKSKKMPFYRHYYAFLKRIRSCFCTYPVNHMKFRSSIFVFFENSLYYTVWYLTISVAAIIWLKYWGYHIKHWTFNQSTNFFALWHPLCYLFLLVDL